MTLKETLAALDALKKDIDPVIAGLAKHERDLSRDHEPDNGRRELHGLIHKLHVALFDVKNSLDTAPTR